MTVCEGRRKGQICETNINDVRIDEEQPAAILVIVVPGDKNDENLQSLSDPSTAAANG